MQESSATCTVQQRSHVFINLRSEPNASVPGGNPQSPSFEEAACIKTNPERAYGKVQSRGGNAYTVLEVGKWRWLRKKRNMQVFTDRR